MGEVVVGARSAGGDDEPGRTPDEPQQRPEPGGSVPGGTPGGAPAGSPAGPAGPGPGSGSGAPDEGAEGPGVPHPGEAPVEPGARSENGAAPDADTPVDLGKNGGAAVPPPGGPRDEESAEEPAAPGGRKRRAKKPAKKGSFWKELPLLLAVALVLALIIKTFFVQAFSIPSASMEDTIQIGDRVLVDKLTPWFGAEPERGEVVVFHDPGGSDPWLEGTPDQSSNGFVRGLQTALSFVGLMPSTNEKDLIKRVIGVGGDTVACCDAAGRITVNGVPLNEPYLKPGVAPSETPFQVTVPKGRLWVMGDNRSNSRDSRAHLAGGDAMTATIDKDEVIGRAFTVIWPLGRIHWLGVPDTFDQKGLSAAPLALGFIGAVPMVLWRRKWVETRSDDATTGAPPA